MTEAQATEIIRLLRAQGVLLAALVGKQADDDECVEIQQVIDAVDGNL